MGTKKPTGLISKRVYIEWLYTLSQKINFTKIKFNQLILRYKNS